MGYFEEVKRKAGESREQIGGFTDPERMVSESPQDRMGSTLSALSGLLGFATAPARALAPRMAEDVAGMGPEYMHDFSKDLVEPFIEGGLEGYALAAGDVGIQAFKAANPTKYARMLNEVMGEAGHVQLGKGFDTGGAARTQARRSITGQPKGFKRKLEGKQLKATIRKAEGTELAPGKSALEKLRAAGKEEATVSRGGTRYDPREAVLSEAAIKKPGTRVIAHETEHLYLGPEGEYPARLKSWADKKVAADPEVREFLLERNYPEKNWGREFGSFVKQGTGTKKNPTLFSKYQKEYHAEKRIASRLLSEEESTLAGDTAARRVDPEQTPKKTNITEEQLRNEKLARGERKPKRDEATEFLRSKGESKKKYVDRSGVERREPIKKTSGSKALKKMDLEKKKRLPDALRTRGGTTPAKNKAGSVGKKQAWKRDGLKEAPKKVVSGSMIRTKLEHARVNAAQLEKDYPGLIQELQKRYGPREKPRTHVAPSAPEGTTPRTVDVGFEETEDLALQQLIDQLKKERGQ